MNSPLTRYKRVPAFARGTINLAKAEGGPQKEKGKGPTDNSPRSERGRVSEIARSA